MTSGYGFELILSNRVQYVPIGQSTSSTLPVIYGVPQGSILGLVLFFSSLLTISLYILLFQSFTFADDAKCIMPIPCRTG